MNEVVQDPIEQLKTALLSIVEAIKKTWQSFKEFFKVMYHIITKNKYGQRLLRRAKRYHIVASGEHIGKDNRWRRANGLRPRRKMPSRR